MIRRLDQVIARKDIINQAGEIKELLKQIVPAFQSEPAQGEKIRPDLHPGRAKEQNTVSAEHSSYTAEAAASKDKE